jgi:hypothetical protein
MTRRLGLLILGLLFSSPSILAQHSCPAGFDYVGTLSLTGSYGSAEEKKEIEFPEGATIDTSYQQTSIRARGGNQKAQSNLRAEDIPKGIHISAAGAISLGKGWAVSKPELRQVQSRQIFGMKLYCTTGGGAYDNMGGCEVAVEVCYKPKK